MELTSKEIEEILVSSFRKLANIDKARVLAFIGSFSYPDESFADLMPTIDAAYPVEGKHGKEDDGN